ncbi:putative HTH-type transcriptional repressor ExuR [Paenibacillus sp. J31TS4]|uniref:LacI family DNA-binding transcriptional regulator n=1 Tax=Paenibacillus sp. J31TS4 TaxID=2807195 RepID=UPI001B1E518C|nr:LacI family DNA-binding transcriptional regulator [Paenibacillus sp. J31TS4]GIP39752.1 putative HTH-type transcriptional repressor ExuR [Paenibacillus sp. J31TS4]
MSATIKDIAQLAGVSHTTVSRALNGSPLIHPATRERIVQIAEQLHYTPNRSARSLVHGRSNSIGIFFSTLGEGTSSSFFHASVRGVSRVLQDRYNLVVRGIDDYADYREVGPKRFEGALVMSQQDRDDAFLRHLQEQQIPHVVLNRRAGGEEMASIVAGDREGAFALTKHLIGLGHRRIAVLEGVSGFRATRERMSGYEDALRAAGLGRRRDYTAAGRYDLASGYEGMLRLLALPERPTAVFCMNDEMAVGALKAAREAGISVPDDLSLAGFDDNGFSAYVTPPLTTVRRPIEEMSREGARVLLAMLEGRPAPAGTTCLPAELVVRGSTGPCGCRSSAG